MGMVGVCQPGGGRRAGGAGINADGHVTAEVSGGGFTLVIHGTQSWVFGLNESVQAVSKCCARRGRRIPTAYESGAA
jgi:hypothetical protein